MAKRNKFVYRGIFEKIEDRAHNRVRHVAKITDQGICTGHVERSLFKAKESQSELTGYDVELMQFRLDDSRIYAPPEEVDTAPAV